MPETIRRAMPNEVGGILRRIVGANEEAERIKSEKFKQLRRRLVKEHALLTFDFEEAISSVCSFCSALIFYLNLFIGR